MGNCCSDTDRVDISSDNNGAVHTRSYGDRHSHNAPATDGKDSSDKVRMTSKPVSSSHPPTLLSEQQYSLQSPLPYPGDARGVYYQPSDTPSALLGMDFSGPDNSQQPPPESSSPPPEETAVASVAAAAAAEAVAAAGASNPATTSTSQAASYSSSSSTTTATTTAITSAIQARETETASSSAEDTDRPQPYITRLSVKAAGSSLAATTAAAVTKQSVPEEPAVTPEASQTQMSTHPPPPTSGLQLHHTASYQPRDVMISYSRNDSDIMREIKGGLEAAGLTVWVDQTSIDAGADFLSKIGEAIIDAKFFICLLSEGAVRSKYCRDEVALAYVSNTAIFPVNLQHRDHLLPLMDTGLKLQLANYNWTSLADPESRSQNIQTLIATLKSEMEEVIGQGLADYDNNRHDNDNNGTPSPPIPTPPTSTTTTTTTRDDGSSPSFVTSSGDGGDVRSPSDVTVTVGGGVGGNGGSSSPVQSPTSDRAAPEFRLVRSRLRERNRARAVTADDDVSGIMPDKFWSDQFGVVDYVPWQRFTEAFLAVYKAPVEAMFSGDDQQQLLDILRRELEVDTDDRIYRYQLSAFCSASGDAQALWLRVQEQARESFAMREVFNMDSSVRVEAIENLGKFRSAAVIDALRDLLTDPDANVRAVATVSLSRTNADDPVTIRHIMRTLTDKDRLVREAGCLALGHLRARQAISKLSHLWRNDVISHVREAAAVALHQIGGQEVEDVMRVTRVLAEEIRSLTEDTGHHA